MSVQLQATVYWGGAELDKATLRAAKSELRSIGSYLARALRTSLRSRKRKRSGKSAPGEVPAMLTGRLAKAVTRDNRGLRKSKPWVRVGIDFKEAPHAGILEFGGVVSSKGGKNMTIPLNDEAEKVLREPNGLRQKISQGEWRVVGPDMQKRFWVIKPGQSKTETGTKGDDEYMVLLTKTLTVKPHPFIRPLVAREAPGIIARLNNAIGKTIANFDVSKGGASVTKW